MRDVIAVLVACTLVVHPPARAEDVSTLRECAAQKEDAKRLACYDAHVPRMLGTGQPNTAESTASAAVGLSSSTDSFGMSAKLERERDQKAPGGAPPKVTRLQGHITAVSLRTRGESVVTLDNGQVWEEAEGSWHEPLRVGDRVIITAGLTGSYWLDADRVPRLRVRRIK